VIALRRFTALLLAAVLAGCSTERPAASGGAPTTPPAATTAGAAPAERYQVKTRELDLNRDGNRPLPVTIWYPDTSTGRFPVIVFSHGLTGLPSDYRRLLADWAAAGFVVAAPTYPNTNRNAAQVNALDVVNQPADASYVLDQVLALDAKAGDRLNGRLDTEHVAAAGHSAGGITTVGLFTVYRDQRLDAGIVLAGSALGMGTGFRGPDAPLLFVHGDADSVVSYASGMAAYDKVPWPKAMLTILDGDHGQTLLRAGNPAYEVVAGATTDFWRWTLYGDAEAKDRMATDAKEGGLATLDDQL
jgi:dienelactone hydrolase